MALQQKKQMTNNVRFKLDDPVLPQRPGAPAEAEADGTGPVVRTGIRAVPDSVTQPGEEAPANGLLLEEIAARLRKKS